MTEELFSLKDEFSKMTGIRTPKELRNLCQEAIDSISALSLPISAIDNPVVTCIASIFTKYQDKYAKNYVPILCDCIINHVFSGNALTSVTYSLLLILNECVDWKTVHKLSSFLQTSVLEDFPDTSVVQSYFSIVLQLMAHKDENISGVCYASFQSMIDILIDAVKSYNKDEIPKDFLTICTDIFGMKSNQFEKPLYFILFLLFNDLSCISVGQKMRFLICQIVPKNVIFDVLEMILSEYIDLFRICPQLTSVFESTVIQSMSDYDSIPFITAFVNCCHEQNPSLCSSLFTEFLEKWKNETFSCLYFFYAIFLFNDGKMPLYLINNENFDGLSIIANLFKKIRSIVDLEKVPESALEFTLKIKTFKRANQEPTFMLTAPVEIVVTSINSFIPFFIKHKRIAASNKSNNSSENNSNEEINNKLDESTASNQNEESSNANINTESGNNDLILEQFNKLFEYTADDVRDVFFYGLKYSTLSSFDVISKSFIKFISESKLQFSDLEVLISFDVLSDSQKLNETERTNFSIQEKKLRWDQVLNRIALDCPQIFASNWYLLFASLFAVSEDTVDLSPSFARHFDDEETKKVLQSLIAVRPFPHLFINDFLISNIDRFDKLWPILDEFFDEEIGRNSKIDDKIFELFIDMILKAFVSKTERQLLELGTKILKSTKSVSIDKKLIVLKELKNVFAQQSQELKNGYPFLFEILDPEMYDKDLLTSAFQMFSVICTDYIHTADPVYVRPCLELIFKYAQQAKDINISLSSFDLIWNVVKIMEKNDDNWTHFLFKISDLFFDGRNDVAHCAVKTFFTYITSNYQQISTKTIDYFRNKGFTNIVNRFSFQNQESLSVLQQILYEIIHFFVTFWDNFNLSNSEIDFYIRKNEELIMNCTVNDLIVNAYQFYECLVGEGIIDNDLNNLVVESLTRLSDNKLVKIENINSSVVSQFGRTIGNLLKSFPRRLTDVDQYSEKDSLAFKSYLQIIEHIAVTYRTENYIHITTQRTLDALSYIIPYVPIKEAEESLEILKHLYLSDNEKIKNAVVKEMEDAFLTCFHPISSETNERSESSNTESETVDEKEDEKRGNRRKWIVIQCKEEILSAYGKRFAEKLVSNKVTWGEKENINEIKDLFVSIKEKYPDLANNVDERIKEME